MTPDITSTANASVKAARKLQQRKHRTDAGRCLVEGPRVLAAARPFLERVFVAEDAGGEALDEARLAEAAGAQHVSVTPEVLATLADTATARGVVGVAALPEPALDTALEGARLAVMCVEVADPGNAGTIVRTADAAGADVVVLSAASVDARNPKAVRASAGSLFHLPVASGAGAHETIAAAREHGLRAVAADASGDVRHTEADLGAPTLLVFGGEARGLPDGVLEACDDVVRVEMFQGRRRGFEGAAESLNLAATAAICCFEAVRQRAPMQGRTS